MTASQRKPCSTDGYDFGTAEIRAMVYRMVTSTHGARIDRMGADVDDVVQDVMVRLILAQSSEWSRWDDTRGMALATYVWRVVHTAGANSLRSEGRQARRGLSACVSESGPPVGPTLERVLLDLDTDQEREMAVHLAAGCSVAEAGQRMGMSERRTSELGTRVRALLLSRREE